MSQTEDVEELGGSELGTVSYWNDTYENEIKNFNKTGDVGEVWFGEDSLLRVIGWILKCDSIKKDDPIIDIGCGNGMTLIELAREGYTNLLGIDYSEPAIELAINVSKGEFPQIQYKVCDIITDNALDYAKKFRVVHDKGTYDAISLNPDNSKAKRNLYIHKMREILQNDGYFVITSCNWTERELREHFKDIFSVKAVIPTPQFRFGGQVGNVVTSLVFQ